MPSKLSFNEQLNFDIEQQEKINSCSKLFIKHRNLKPHEIKNNGDSISDKLPIECSLGSSFLIKDNNIIEFYCWCDSNYSMYLQINKQKPMWIGNTFIINKELNDPEKLEYFLDGCNIFYNPSNYMYLISQFLDMGFRLYKKI